MSQWDSLALRGALFGSVAAVAVMSADAAWAQAKSFNIPAQPASSGVAALARQGDVQILITAAHAEGRRTNAVVGSYTVVQALDVLLAGTGLQARSTGAQTFSVVPRETAEIDPDAVFMPDVLVRGNRNWSLNTDIRRSEDGAQPYVVFTEEDLKRSGAVSLDSFFRDFLGANNSAATADTAPALTGRSQINLRGMGIDQTLVLVDGRRLPGTNTGTGFLEQPTVVGIPMSQIERIEVLPSSASSVYGGGATGGVINIIMKRDYRGIELTTTYADVFDGSAPDTRADLSGGINLEGGRTNISASLSYRNAEPLEQGERDFLRRGRAHLLEVNPNYFNQNLLLGATPNIRSTNGALLTLDPAYGGGSIGSNHTYIPYGYRGVALDGVAPLVSNAGQYNFDLAPTATGYSRDSLLTTGQKSINGSLAVRREFTSWLSLYGEVQAQRTENESVFSRGPSIVTVAANAPNNPFQQAITVHTPPVGSDATSRTTSETRRGLAGAIIQLPFHWQANLDYSYNWSRFGSGDDLPSASAATTQAITSGALDVLRDPSLFPLTYTYLTTPTRREPSLSTTKAYSIRLAGALPLDLPGGRPAVTLVAERTDQWVGDSLYINSRSDFGAINYTPARTQTTDSVFLQVRAPLVGPENKVPLVHALELEVSARYDAYEGRGTVAGINCLLVGRPLTEEEIGTACPPNGVQPAADTASRSHTDPTYAVRWQPTPDITFRGSFGTGYLPPYLHQLVKTPRPLLLINVADPERGGELLGAELFPGFRVLQGANFDGGNPDIKPERSETLSLGTILTPRFVPGLRLSIDWTRTEKRDAYFTPGVLLSPSTRTAQSQATFEDFYRAYPERFIRGPASGGFPVGRIIAIDASYANLNQVDIEALDVSFDYTRDVWGGELKFAANATQLRKLETSLTENSPLINNAGVVGGTFASGLTGGGGLSWKGNGSVHWSNDTFSIGWRARFFDDYYLRTDHGVEPNQGAARIPSQIYHDLTGSWAVRPDIDLRWSINNILNRRPPIDTGTSFYYSKFGDPRLASFQVALTKRF